MSNYDRASKLLEKGGFELTLMSANVHATLALVDEMRESRKPVEEVKAVHLIHAFDPMTDLKLKVVAAHRDRDKAYLVRDEMNAKASELEKSVRYVIETVGLV